MNTRKFSILLLVIFSGSLHGKAQKAIFSVGSTSALTIKNGTVFGIDSLVLTPSADLTLSSNTFSVSPVPANVAPSPSINRVYSLAGPIGFTGTIQLYYQLSELNGNPESSLRYTDSASGGAWLAEASSTVNTTNHYVQYTVSSSSFIAATASHQGTSLLPITLVSFGGNWNGNAAALEWVEDQSDETVNFEVESSPDGISWKQIGQVAGTSSNGLFTYSFTDEAPPGNTPYYRIVILLASGQTIYSNIVALQKEGAAANTRLVVNGNSASVYFTGTQPTAIRLINVSGQVLTSNNTSLPEYNFNGLYAGAYFLQYQLNGRWFAREFVVY
jgi:hypothetical protein